MRNIGDIAGASEGSLFINLKVVPAVSCFFPPGPCGQIRLLARCVAEHSTSPSAQFRQFRSSPLPLPRLSESFHSAVGSSSGFLEGAQPPAQSARACTRQAVPTARFAMPGAWEGCYFWYDCVLCIFCEYRMDEDPNFVGSVQCAPKTAKTLFSSTGVC